MKKTIFLLLVLFSIQFVHAQKDMYNLYFNKAEVFLKNAKYIDAFEYFDTAIDQVRDVNLINKAKKKRDFCKKKIRQQQNELRRQQIELKKQLVISKEAIRRAEKAEEDFAKLTNKSNTVASNKELEVIKSHIKESELSELKTPTTGKTINDFTIPEYMIKEDKELVNLIMLSESMNDGERQYWFDLTKTMNLQQVDKLRDILLTERKKLAEIEKKYGVSDELKVGIRLFNNKEYDKALTHFLKIKKNPQSNYYLNQYIARLYALKNDFKQADKYVQKIEGSRSISQAYRSIGNDFYEIKNYTDAVKSHLFAVTYDDTNSSSYYAAGVNYYMLGNKTKAKEYFNKACSVTENTLKDKPTDNNTYWNLSWYSLFANKPQQAITSAKKSLELAPEKEGVYSNLVLAYVLNNEFEKAKEIYLRFKNEQYDKEQSWKEVFINDLDDLSKSGITHPDFSKVKALLNS